MEDSVREGARAGRLTAPFAGHSRASGPHLLMLAVLTVISFCQRVGETTFDTKFDLTADPARMLGRSLDLWGTNVDLGSLANQGYGYLFPQGSFFLLGDLLAIPDWISQRAWSTLVLLIAYDGARRLARAWGIGRSTAVEAWVPVAVGAAYALSPRLVGLSGALTGEILPSAVLPWICLPLVLGLSGRLSARRAAVLAGLAVIAMGGLNATENLLALLLPLFLMLSAARTPQGRRLALWWVGCTTLASLWWMLPLVLLGRYGAPFLDYVETAATTTRTAGWSNTVRGTEHWLNYVDVGGAPFWNGAYSMSSAGILVVLGGLIVAIGVAGLARTGETAIRWRGPLLLTLTAGLLVATSGHGGIAGTTFAGSIRDLLDGSLAPFRNVHKADPSIRLPLVLGFGAGCGALADLLARHRRHRVSVRHPLVAAMIGVLVLASAAPVFAGSLRHPGWEEIPASWRQAATWLDHDGPGATLVVPAAGFGEQTWGWTEDEPLQGLVSSGWVARTQIPLIPAASIRLLDGIGARLEDGSGSAALAPTLAASGITRILLRNDLDPRIAEASDALRVATALAASPGIAKVKTFGSTALPDLEVYRVSGGAPGPTAAVRADLPLLTGAPEDVITAREAGLIADDGHVRVGRARAGAAPDLVTDGYRLVERDFGRSRDAVSDVRTPGEPSRTGRTVVDYAGVPGVPRLFAQYPGLTSVTASTSVGYADTFGPVRAEFGPAAVLDDDPSTSWRSAPFTAARGQYVDLNLAVLRPIGAVRVLAGAGGAGVRVTRFAVTAGRARKVVAPDALGRVLVDFGGIQAHRVRVRVLAISGTDPLAQVAIRDIAVTGVDTSRTLVVPDVAAGSSTSFVFSAAAPRRPCLYGALGTTCDSAYAREGPERGRLDRTVTLHGSGTWTLSGAVVAQASLETARLLLPLRVTASAGVVATSTSVLGNDPPVSAVFAADGQPATSWLAAHGDLSPVLDLSWHKPHTLSRLQVRAALTPALSPYEAVVEANGQTRRVPLGAGDLGFFTPIKDATSARVTFYARSDADHHDESVGVGEVEFDGLEGLAQPVRLDSRFTSPCGLGPDVDLAGRRYRTQVRGTLGDIVSGRPLDWRSCDGAGDLADGQQRVRMSSTQLFVPIRLVLRSESAATSAARTRPISAASDLASSMRLDVGSGPGAVLVFNQNANPGWRAELAGRRLTPIVVDGWQQGFVVPAGAGGRVRVEFGPQTAYRIALGTGAVGVLILIALLLLDVRRPRPCLDLPVPWEPDNWSRRWVRIARTVGAGVVLLVLGGPAVAGSALVGILLVRRNQSLTPVLAGASVLASAFVAAIADRTSVGVPGSAADLLAALGCGLLIGTLAAASEVLDA